MSLVVIAILIFLLNIKRMIKAFLSVGTKVRLHKKYHVSFAISVVLCVVFVATLSIAVYRGMGNIWLTPIQDIYSHALTTPADQALTFKQGLLRNTLKEGTLVVFYRWDCDDCEKFYSEYRTNYYEGIQPTHTVYFVSTRSFFGHDIAQKYQIKNVPTICQITQDIDGTLTLKSIGDSIKLLYK